MTPTLSISDRFEIETAIQFQAVVDGRSTHRGGGRNGEQVRRFFLSGDNPCRPTIGFSEGVVKFAAPNKARHHLTAQKRIVRRNSAKDISVHHVHKAVSTTLCIPADELVADSKVEHGIANRDQADQFVVVAIPHKIPEPPPVTVGHRYGPRERSEPEQLCLPTAGEDTLRLGVNRFGINLTPRSEIFEQRRRPPSQELFTGGQPLPSLRAVRGANQFLVATGDFESALIGLAKAQGVQMLSDITLEGRLGGVQRNNHRPLVFHVCRSLSARRPHWACST